MKRINKRLNDLNKRINIINLIVISFEDGKIERYKGMSQDKTLRQHKDILLHKVHGILPLIEKTAPPYKKSQKIKNLKDQPALIHSQWHELVNHYWKNQDKKKKLSFNFEKSSNFC